MSGISQYLDANDIQDLVGLKVESVEISLCKTVLRLNGCEYLNTVGDCCSESWIEHIEGVGALFGTIKSVEEIVISDSWTTDDDLLQIYAFKITTDKGVCTIDFRNRSNGFYGGEMTYLSKDNPERKCFKDMDMEFKKLQDDF